jgi:hypothetical protein
VTQDDGAIHARRVHHVHHIGREVSQGQSGHRSDAAADASRLKPEHAKPGLRHMRRQIVEIRRAASERRDHDDGRPTALVEVDKACRPSCHGAGVNLRAGGEGIVRQERRDETQNEE